MADQQASARPGRLRVCFCVDDVAAGDGRRIGRLFDFLEELGVPASLFVIPYSLETQATVLEDPELVKALQAGAEAGHAVLPHAFTHELFECGLPDLMCIGEEGMMKRIARTLSREEFQLRHQHTRTKMGALFSQAAALFEQLTGEPPRGFRSGYHEFCREMYLALEDCGFKWSSSRTAVPGAWRSNVGREADEVVTWVGLRPYWVGDILEIPHCADYGSHLPPSEVNDWVELARRHMQACREQGGPFVCTCSQAGLGCVGDPQAWRDTGYRAYQQVIALAREEFDAEFLSLPAYAEDALAQPDKWLRRDEYRR